MKGRLTELVIVSIILLLSLVSLGLGSAYAHQAVASPKDLDNDDAWAMTPNPTTALIAVYSVFMPLISTLFAALYLISLRWIPPLTTQTTGLVTAIILFVGWIVQASIWITCINLITASAICFQPKLVTSGAYPKYINHRIHNTLVVFGFVLKAFSLALVVVQGVRVHKERMAKKYSVIRDDARELEVIAKSTTSENGDTQFR